MPDECRGISTRGKDDDREMRILTQRRRGAENSLRLCVKKSHWLDVSSIIEDDLICENHKKS